MNTYRVRYNIAAVTTAKTLLYITTPADRMVQIIRAEITCTNEDTAEQIYAEFNRITTLGTPAATPITPKPIPENVGASLCQCFANVTGSEPTYDADLSSGFGHKGANKLASWEYIPILEERDWLGVSQSAGLRLIDDIGGSCDLVAEIVYQEVG